MSFVVRKIEYNKWHQRNILDGEQPSADAITHDLKTKKNTLSVWTINDEGELKEAVLAITAQCDYLDTIVVLWFDRSFIEGKGLDLVSKPGLTPYTDFLDEHLDITNLDYLSLGVVAKVIVESLRQKRWKRIERGKIKDILTEAVRGGKVQWSELKPHVQEKIPNN